MGLFEDLQHEIRRDYGFTRESIPFIPFERWREKLQTYPNEFREEYGRNLCFLNDELGLANLSSVENPNKKLVLFAGIPGAGKTTLAHIVRDSIPDTVLLRGHDVVDMLKLYGENVETFRQRLRERGFFYPDPWYISYLYQEQLTRNCLNLGYNVVFDDHIRTRDNRQGYFKLAGDCGAKMTLVQINAPFQTYVEREEGEINEDKLKFIARFILQSEDVREEEQRQYSVIQVDGTSSVKEIERTLIPKIVAA